jgi:hypothetical protein
VNLDADAAMVFGIGPDLPAKIGTCHQQVASCDSFEGRAAVLLPVRPSASIKRCIVRR